MRDLPRRELVFVAIPKPATADARFVRSVVTRTEPLKTHVRIADLIFQFLDVERTRRQINARVALPLLNLERHTGISFGADLNSRETIKSFLRARVTPVYSQRRH